MESLQNYFLIAMPSLDDPGFNRSVIYVCEHNQEGAMGLVVNQPAEMNVMELLERTKVEPREGVGLERQPVYAGGPVATDRGFVLHSPQQGWRSSLQLSDNMMITTSMDILESLGSDAAPGHYLLTVGYAGWDAGQLEEELADNSWLTIPADPEIIFHTPSSERWQKATEQLGIDIWQLAPQAGRA